ncbi:MAG: hypothetical protein BAJALOKI2v1_420030, partial [Promethearchaeota archaeon]
MIKILMKLFIFYDKNFNETFENLNRTEIVFILFLLKDLGYIKMSHGFEHPQPTQGEHIYGSIEINNIT